jgi:hypothetical protein
MAFFLAGQLKTGPRPIHKPYFGVKNDARPVHVESWLFSSSRPLDDPIFHVDRTWIGIIHVQCWFSTGSVPPISSAVSCKLFALCGYIILSAW